MKRLLIALTCLALVASVNVIRADENEQYQQITQLARDGKLTEAEEAFQAAIKEYPDSRRIKSLHSTLYSYNNRAENYELARDHLEAYITLNLLPTEENPKGNLSSLPDVINVLLKVYENAGQQKQGGERLGEILTLVESIAEKDKDNLYAQTSSRELANRKLLFQAQTGQADEARIALSAHLAAAEAAVKAQSDDSFALLDLMYFLKGDYELAKETGSNDAAEKQEKFLERLLKAANEHPENVSLISMTVGEYISTIGGLARKEPDKAEALLEKLKAFQSGIESEDPLVKAQLANIDRATPSLQRSLESGKFHAALIGQAAFPLAAEAWVNGEPLTDSDLKGKVVLLDFWAVWCGPCIATFPHLREWQEKYQDKGFVIIGVTRYYKYGWNEESNRPQKLEELAPEDEQAAMLKFAEHYELKHRFMVTPAEATYHKDYGVSGIPQAVLIDREGKIRLIRVGSGEENAGEIATLLAELIEEGN